MVRIMHYYELWNVLASWKDEFTSREFSQTFYSPDAAKVLHDMEGKGMLERVGFGKYRVRTQAEYLKKRSNLQEAYALLNKSGKQYALTDVDGVFIWTKGGYNIDRFFGFYPIHLKVKQAEVNAWKGFFKSQGYRAFLEGERPGETLYGVFYILHPAAKIHSETVEGVKVESLQKAVEFATERIAAYQPGLEMLDTMYGLKTGIKYAEANSNTP